MYVLIIGAGCTGLLIAQGLRKLGIEATVFERSTRDRPFRDWSMLLHWGREAVKEVLPADIAEQLFKEAGTDPSLLDFQTHEHAQPMPVYNGKTGEVLVDLGWPAIRRYSRARAVEILRRGIDVRYGQELIDIVLDGDDSVRLTFKDGLNASGDVVVGADSANSFVRSWLFHHDPRARVSDLPIIAYNIYAKYPRDVAITLREHPHILNKLAIHPEHTTWYMLAPLSVPDLAKPEDWTFQHFMSHWSDDARPADSSEDRLRDFKRLGATYAEPFRSAIAMVDDQTLVPYDRLKYWAEPTLWDNRNGRVTLAGDAAHPFPPHRGQGLNNSFQDAANLVKTLAAQAAGSTFIDSMRSYDTEVLERGKREIEMSCQQAYASTHWDSFIRSPAVQFGLRRVDSLTQDILETQEGSSS